MEITSSFQFKCITVIVSLGTDCACVFRDDRYARIELAVGIFRRLLNIKILTYHAN